MVRTDATMPPFNIISRRSTSSFKRNYKLQESEDERRAKLDIGNELARFLMGTIFLVIVQVC